MEPLTRQGMEKYLFKIIPLAMAAILVFVGFSCRPIDSRQPPTDEEVYAVRDSIRTTLLLRLGNALQAINHRSEMMRRRAYSEPEAKARQLRRTVEQVEEDYKALEARLQLLQQDSVLGDWYQQQEEIEIKLREVAYTLGLPL